MSLTMMIWAMILTMVGADVVFDYLRDWAFEKKVKKYEDEGYDVVIIEIES